MFWNLRILKGVIGENPSDLTLFLGVAEHLAAHGTSDEDRFAKSIISRHLL
jgi:hypothetical protein